MSTHLPHWLCALLIALVLSAAHLLDGPSEIEAAQDVAADLHDVVATTTAQVQP